jgi:hypothetical protein
MVVENFWRARNKHLVAESRSGNAKLSQRAGRVFSSDRETQEPRPGMISDLKFQISEKAKD